MDRTEVNASPVQKALQGIKKYKYVLLTALLGVLLLLLPVLLQECFLSCRREPVSRFLLYLHYSCPCSFSP